MPPVWLPANPESAYLPMPADWTAYFIRRQKPPMALAETALVSDVLSIPLSILHFLERCVVLSWKYCTIFTADNAIVFPLSVRAYRTGRMSLSLRA